MSTLPKISIRGLTKHFDGAPTHALENVDLDIGANEFVTFVGASGCGKSTLLRTIGGLEVQTAGELLVDNRP
ncbi:MAG: ATP-binding cassette domain-containing protein, partial [Hydrogenophaga sp.]|nr:ATP-binding cassette domain-containing protein [Hydrogenophaga sp.]